MFLFPTNDHAPALQLPDTLFPVRSLISAYVVPVPGPPHPLAQNPLRIPGRPWDQPPILEETKTIQQSQRGA